MTQQGTSVHAHPENPVDTSTVTAEPEEAQPDCGRPAQTHTAKTDAHLPKLGSVVIDVQGDTFDLQTPNADVIDRAADTTTSSRAYQAHRQPRVSYVQRFNDSRSNSPGQRRKE